MRVRPGAAAHNRRIDHPAGKFCLNSALNGVHAGLLWRYVPCQFPQEYVQERANVMQLDASTPAIVTGGASGLGEATARAIAATGAKVTIFDLNEERGQMVAGEIDGVFARVDVSDAANIAAGFETARAAHGQERVQVNCAGIAVAEKTAGRSRSSGEIKAHDLGRFEKVLKINLWGSFACASTAAAGMMSLEPANKDGERGVIINTASVSAEDGQMGQVAYAASKGGVVGMTLPMARDLAREGVRIATILPGFFETPIYDTLPDEVKGALRAHVQFPQRFGRPDEYADLVTHICANAYLNACIIRTDAGARMPPR